MTSFEDIQNDLASDSDFAAVLNALMGRIAKEDNGPSIDEGWWGFSPANVYQDHLYKMWERLMIAAAFKARGPQGHIDMGDCFDAMPEVLHGFHTLGADPHRLTAFGVRFLSLGIAPEHRDFETLELLYSDLYDTVTEGFICH